MYCGLHAQHPSFLSDFTETRQIFEKYSNMKFHKTPSRGSRVVPCRRTDGRSGEQTDRQTWRS